MTQLLADIEVYTNYFLLGCQDYQTKDRFSYEISEDIDQRQELYKFLNEYNGFWISFNGIRYDNMVLAYGQSNKWWPKEDWKTVCRLLKAYSDKVIQDDESNYKERWFNWKFTNIDLYLYWSLNLRLSKRVSLKSLGIQLGYPVVQELPFDPDLILDRDQRAELKHYNLEHDLGILRLLTECFEGKGKVPLGNLGTIQLRGQVYKDLGINTWSMDTPKIASEVLLKSYCEITKQDLKPVRDLRFTKPTIRFDQLFDDLSVEFKLPGMQRIYNKWYNSIDTFNEEFVTGTKRHPVKISVGVGGIHAINKNEIYESDNEHVILTSDIAAMYPTNIENWQAFRFPEVLSSYTGYKTKRIAETKPGLKSTKKGSPEWTEFFQKDLFYKLILNGVSGLLDMEYSWLYNPEKIMKVRCGGQLILMCLMEECILNDIDVLSANTDGIEVYMRRDQVDLYNSLVKKVEEKFNVQFESEGYKKIIYSSVNDYLAILDNGQLKKKGMFVTQPELGNSVDFLIIPKLLEQYFVYGIKPEVAITKDWHIYDFCASQKCDRSYTVEWKGEKQQRLNRYYASTKGAYLYKCKWVKKENKKTKLEYEVYTRHHMLGDSGVMLYNNHVEKPLKDYSINYSFYLAQVNKLIAELERLNQLQLF